MPARPKPPAGTGILFLLEDLTEPELAAIGAVAVQSAYLEGEIQTFILGLSKMTIAQGEVFLDRAMLEAKLSILSKIMETRLAHRPKKLNEFKKIISDVRTQNDQRTTAIHGTWITGMFSKRVPVDETRNPKALKWKRGVVFKELSVVDAGKLANEIKRSREELWAFFSKTWPSLFGE